MIIPGAHLFDFHAWTTSGSVIPCFLAASSNKSNNHLIAEGSASFTVRIVLKKSSTNFCIVPLVESNRVRNISGMALWVRSVDLLFGNWWSSMGFIRWYTRGFVPDSMSPPLAVIICDWVLLRYIPVQLWHGCLQFMIKLSFCREINDMTADSFTP